jgi:hypothetical protein
MEAPLTGESVPISKNLDPVGEAAALGDRRCMLYSATNVSAGQGLGVVVATGDSAEIGKISKMVSKGESRGGVCVCGLGGGGAGRRGGEGCRGAGMDGCCRRVALRGGL